MSIDWHLNNFPTLCQNAEPANPYPDINSHMDCVPTSIAAALWWFTGTEYYGNEIIDAVYGAGYTGGTAAVQYENYCAARGVKLSPVNGTPAELVTAIHTYLHENCPVLVTVPGQWNSQYTSGTNPGPVTHVMCVCGDGPASIQVMNPWTGAFEVYSDAWFHVKLCYGQIWPMEATHMVPANWSDDGTTLTAPNGQKVMYGFRQKILSMPEFDPANVPLGPETASQNVDGKGPGSFQDFTQWSFGYTAANEQIFFLPVGASLKQAQSDLTAEQTQVVNLNVTINNLKAQINQLMSQPVSGNAADTAAMDELAKALPMLAKALSSRAPGLVPVGVQTKPLPAVQ